MSGLVLTCVRVCNTKRGINASVVLFVLAVICHSACSFHVPQAHLQVVGMLQFVSSDINQPSLPTPFFLWLLTSVKTILQGTVKGGRRQGRWRKRWEDNIREWTGLEFAKSQRAVENRENGGNWLCGHLWCPSDHPRLRDRWRKITVRLGLRIFVIWDHAARLKKILSRGILSHRTINLLTRFSTGQIIDITREIEMTDLSGWRTTP